MYAEYGYGDLLSQHRQFNLNDNRQLKLFKDKYMLKINATAVIPEYLYSASFYNVMIFDGKHKVTKQVFVKN